MSENYSSYHSYSSSSDSWSSSYTNFEPSPSSFSTYDIFHEAKPTQSSSNQSSSNPSSTSFYHDPQYKNLTLQNHQEENQFQNLILESVYEQRKNNQKIQERQFDGQNVGYKKENATQGQKTNDRSLPYKKLQDFTIKEILQLPLTRQEYLKKLSIDQLSQQAQYKFIFSRPYTVFEIGHYYQKQITDEDLKTQIVKFRNRQDFGNFFMLGSFLGYAFCVDRLEKLSPFKGQFGKAYHLAIPLTSILIISIFDAKRTNKKQRILQDQGAKSQFKKLVRKYLCQTNEKERRNIIEKDLPKEEKNKN